MIIVTQFFEKNLKKLGKPLDTVVKEINKYHYDTGTYVPLGEYTTPNGNTYNIGKDYIDHRKMRLVVLLKVSDFLYIPISLVPKDSEKGYNITKENIKELFKTDLRKCIEDINNGKYKKI